MDLQVMNIQEQIISVVAENRQQNSLSCLGLKDHWFTCCSSVSIMNLLLTLEKEWWNLVSHWLLWTKLSTRFLQSEYRQKK